MPLLLLFYNHHMGQPESAGIPGYETTRFRWSEVLLPPVHTVADGKQHIWIREKKLGFSSVLLLTPPSPYLVLLLLIHPFNGLFS